MTTSAMNQQELEALRVGHRVMVSVRGKLGWATVTVVMPGYVMVSPSALTKSGSRRPSVFRYKYEWASGMFVPPPFDVVTANVYADWLE